MPQHPRWYIWSGVGLFSFAITLGFLAARPHGDTDLWDFGSFHLSGYTARDGLNPYGVDLFNKYAEEFHATLTAPNLNPPVSILVFWLVSKVNPFVAFRAWWWLSLGLYVCAVM